MGCTWTWLQRAVSRVQAAAVGLMSVHLQRRKNYEFYAQEADQFLKNSGNIAFLLRGTDFFKLNTLMIEKE